MWFTRDDITHVRDTFITTGKVHLYRGNSWHGQKRVIDAEAKVSGALCNTIAAVTV
jgi:hypothetical protein